MLSIFFLLPLIFATPSPQVNWIEPDGSIVEIKVKGEDPLIQTCIENGLEMHYRFQYQLCRRRSFWLDRCDDIRQEVHQLGLSPILERYTVTVDRHRDGRNPKTTSYQSAETALKAFRKMKKLDIAVLAGWTHAGSDRLQKRYLSVRVLSSCKGEYNETLAKLSHVLSFGFGRIDGFNSGWQHFNLKH